MAELGELLKKAAKQEKLIGSGVVTQIMDEVSALDYDGLVKTIPDLLPKLGKVLEKRLPEMEEIDTGKATAFVLKYLPKMAEKIISSDEEVKDELGMTEDMTFNLNVTGSDGNIAEMRVDIKDGNISFNPGQAEEKHFIMDISTEKLLRIMSGEDDAISGFMGGGIEMWREETDESNAIKVLSLMPLITLVAQKLKLEKMM
jgi:putative sterol carrier protein